MRWYRIEVPPGCVAVVPPRLKKPFRMLINGHEIAANGDAVVPFNGLLEGGKKTLVIIAYRNDPIDTAVQFQTGVTPFPLTPWTKTGLANYSGTAVYTKTFAVPDSYLGRRLVLDLGRVSAVAEVYVNDKSAGTLVWSPYRLDITKLVKPGENQLRVLVTNTEANSRAVGTSRHILARIDVCGLEGPVQIVPYIDDVLTLHAAN
jgi:hypothetical protein